LYPVDNAYFYTLLDWANLSSWGNFLNPLTAKIPAFSGMTYTRLEHGASAWAQWYFSFKNQCSFNFSFYFRSRVYYVDDEINSTNVTTIQGVAKLVSPKILQF